MSDHDNYDEAITNIGHTRQLTKLFMSLSELEILLYCCCPLFYLGKVDRISFAFFSGFYMISLKSTPSTSSISWSLLSSLVFFPSTVGGLGFGMISGIVSFANVVEAASGPGVVGITGGVDSRYFVLVSGQPCH